MPFPLSCHAGASPMARGNEPAEGLLAAARLGLTDKLKLALDQASCDVVNAKDETGGHAVQGAPPGSRWSECRGRSVVSRSPHHCYSRTGLAASGGNREPARPRDPTPPTQTHRSLPPGPGRTALHHAASCGYEDCVELLLERGADGSIQDEAGDTPLHLAAQVGCDAVLGSGGELVPCCWGAGLRRQAFYQTSALRGPQGTPLSTLTTPHQMSAPRAPTPPPLPFLLCTPRPVCPCPATRCAPSFRPHAWPPTRRAGRPWTWRWPVLAARS